ncbi:threonine/serine exporter family protein [Secundilactobacillus paracollinoides]|uniref:threonine/serine exporter family protein n=1 Tax=Secundilactobacillus paracollinoides TaxID=240427 RepID=UPI0006F1370B|nr:threonine/serine exporter family protein [Secundilactobacillus paracollinoides]KRL80399.1 hypothetical protein FC17_GL003208 [Secundilactobacillus paracollinoides DSM 15502 = JCM 11969]
MEILVGFIFSFLSTVGFGVITNVPRRTLLPAGLTGALAWVVYLLVQDATSNVILPNLLAAITICVLANVAAIVVRAPVNVLYIPCLVSLVPGAIIFLSMKGFTLGQDNTALQNLLKTLTIAMSLAVGFLIAEAFFSKLRPVIKRWAAKQK